MKKLLLLLLFTSISFGQTTLANKLKITANITDNTAAKVNVQTADGFVNTIAKIDLQDVLTFTNEASFPVVGLTGKLYLATSSPTKLYRWNGTVYNEVGGSQVLKTIEGQSILGAGNIDLTKSDVGLPLVDNTADLNKPISTSTQNALNNKKNNLQFEQSSSNILTVNTNSISWCKLFTTSTENFLGAIVNFSVISGTSVDSGQINIQGAFYDMSDASFYPFIEVTHQTYNARLTKIMVIKESGKLAVYAQINAADMLATLRWNLDSVDIVTTVNNSLSSPANETGVFTLPTFFYVKANNRGYIQRLNGDIDIAGKLTTPSPVLTGIPTAPTAPLGTNTTQIANMLAVQQANAGNVKLVGDQDIFGKKTFTNSSNGISINVNNSGANAGVLISNTANGTGLGILNQLNGAGLICENQNSGNGIVSNGNVSSTGFVFAGQNNGLRTFTVNKEGDTVVAKLNVNQIINLANAPTFSSALLANSSSLVMGDVYQVNGVLMIIQPKP